MLRLTEKLNLLDAQQNMPDEQPLISEQSICNYFANVLNTRIGSVAITPQTGMPTINLSTAGRHNDELIDYIKSQVLNTDQRVAQFETISIANNVSNVLLAFKVVIHCYDLTTFKCHIKIKLDNTVEVTLL